MKKIFNYKKYLTSVEWLLKKNELINIYLKNDWDIECASCCSTDNLQVHHKNYKQIGKEDLKGKGVHQLAFLCRNCHYDTHYEDIKMFRAIEEVFEETFKRK